MQTELDAPSPRLARDRTEPLPNPPKGYRQPATDPLAAGFAALKILLDSLEEEQSADRVRIDQLTNELTGLRNRTETLVSATFVLAALAIGFFLAWILT